MSSSTDAQQTDWTQAGLTEICDHIEATHHRFLTEELPQISSFVDTVSQVHGDCHPSLYQVREVFTEMSRGILAHLKKEEQIFFPLIRQLEEEGVAPQAGSVAMPIQRMESEHDDSGDALRKLRELTDGFVPPPDACGTYRAMLTGLQQLERDMHQHIHKEDNILFPRAVKKEEELSRS